jgi:hypothetical protein
MMIVELVLSKSKSNTQKDTSFEPKSASKGVLVSILRNCEILPGVSETDFQRGMKSYIIRVPVVYGLEEEAEKIIREIASKLRKAEPKLPTILFLYDERQFMELEVKMDSDKDLDTVKAKIMLDKLSEILKKRLSTLI